MMALMEGSRDDLMHDLKVVDQEGAEIGLQLNKGKSEIICVNPDTSDSLLQSLAGAQVVDPANATLLGSSIGDVSSISVILSTKVDMVKRMGVRLQHLSAQDALLLLRHSFPILKLLYNLRTSPCFLSPVLLGYDKLLKSIVGSITNICFEVSDWVWDQATFPVKMGVLSIRSTVQLHLPPS